MSARSEQMLDAIAAGVSEAQAYKMSGADLQQAAFVAQGGGPVGPGKDGPRMEQLSVGQV